MYTLYFHHHLFSAGSYLLIFKLSNINLTLGHTQYFKLNVLIQCPIYIPAIYLKTFFITKISLTM